MLFRGTMIHSISKFFFTSINFYDDLLYLELSLRYFTPFYLNNWNLIRVFQTLAKYQPISV